MADVIFLNHIDGADRAAAGGGTLDIEDPSTGEVYATAPLSGPEDEPAAPDGW